MTTPENFPPITYTRITSTSCELAKSYELVDGIPVSSAIAHMTSGHARIEQIADVTQLRTVLESLTAHEAIVAGIPVVGNTPLTTRAGSEFNPNAVARTNENFRYPDTPALFLIDVDTTAGTYHSVGDVMSALEHASPWLCDVLRVGRPSSSSFIAGKGLRGVHVYLAVTCGSDIPALAKRLQVEQWAAGRGEVVISRSGALLVRQLSDALVYQPSRLMFEAPPILADGIVRQVPPEDAWVVRVPSLSRRSPAWCVGPGMLDATAMPAVRDIAVRRFEAAVRQAKQSKRVAAKRVALDYHRANALAAGREDGDVLGVRALRAMGDGILPPSWPLVFERDGQLLRGTVADALAALGSVMGRRCADPFDATRHDLTASDLRAAEVCTMGGDAGVWSHKLGQFFAFGVDDSGELTDPLELAAERLCGTIEEWPDRADKKHSSVSNLIFAVGLLCREAGIRLSFDVCADTLAGDVPPMGDWLAAVTRLGASNVSVGSLEIALDTLARAHPVDPWKDAILGLPLWDKRPRLDTIFTDLYAAPGSDALTGAAQVFFAGLVMRQLRPGAPCPVVPVLIGEQRLGKGMFGVHIAETMGWPPPAEISFGDERKMSMAAARGPVAELAEMSGLRRKENEEVKRWTTDTQDVYRAPYGRRELAHPRRFVLFGTANKHELNNDETGNSRFMPVICQEPPAADWAVELPQILAEAKARFCETPADYTRLIRSVPELVKAHNAADMRAGRGTVVSDLDDLLPPILTKLAHGGRINSSDIRTALDATPSGRQFTARQVAAWLRARNWSAALDTHGRRFYRAPADWVQPAAENVVPLSPFGVQK